MFQEILAKIARAFEHSRIPYMIVGGQAVLLYGVPRLTQVIDVTLGVGPDRIDDLLEIVTRLGWEVLVDDVREFVRKTLVLPCQEPHAGIRVDMIFSYSPYERQAIGRARPVLIGDSDIPFRQRLQSLRLPDEL